MEAEIWVSVVDATDLCFACITIPTFMSADATTSSPQRGLFIVLEGLDRCGKSTQVDRLVVGLERSGRPARLQKFPGP